MKAERLAELKAYNPKPTDLVDWPKVRTVLFEDYPELVSEVERLTYELAEQSAHNGMLIVSEIIPLKKENARLLCEINEAYEYLRETYGFDTRDDFKITKALTHIRRALNRGDEDVEG